MIDAEARETRGVRDLVGAAERSGSTERRVVADLAVGGDRGADRPTGSPGVRRCVGSPPDGSPSLRRTSTVTGTSTKVNVESSRANGGSAKRLGEDRDRDLAGDLVAVAVADGVGEARGRLRPRRRARGDGVNWIFSRLNTTACPRRISGWVTDTTVSGSPSGSTSLAVTSTTTDWPTTTLSVSAVTTGGRFGSTSSITPTSTEPRTTWPLTVVDVVLNGTSGAAPARADDRQLFALDGDLETAGQRLHHGQRHRIAVRVGVVDEHGHRCGRRCGAAGRHRAARPGDDWGRRPWPPRRAPRRRHRRLRARRRAGT